MELQKRRSQKIFRGLQIFQKTFKPTGHDARGAESEELIKFCRNLTHFINTFKTAWNLPKLGNNELLLENYARYLGVILDSKLLWKHNVEERVKKASNALYACKRMLGVTWDLSPSMMHWCYTAVVRPILLYGTLVWWTATKTLTYLMPLERIQRLAALCITGAMKTTPTAALEMILRMPPIDLMAENLAAKSARRLMAAGVFTCRTFGHSSVGKWSSGGTDYMTPYFNWERRFRTTIEEEGWHKGMKPGHRTFHIYTDGSKTPDGVRAGIYCSKLGIRQPIKLPDHLTFKTA
ncbi:uncharacterized protein LOC128870357 [Anastrepha ludens]|uniref:uncharacterized protein LOC128870357 n=1 Tax=Anastrepha ludens TaxID=28586 RepID=UPI0023B081FD|nr:uncharacterized protein LOC128870357 [Anastrepha ludens]XP_053968956.1 uncharacterized protein LOC128870357 [Anastrepha ludens]